MFDEMVDLMGANGQALGEVAGRVASYGLDPNAMRPWIGRDGKVYITVCKRGCDPKKKESWTKQAININTATLRRDEWKQLDDQILEVSRQRLGGIDDLIAKGLTYNLGNAMGTTVLEWHDVSDGMEAIVTMDGVTRGKNDRPVYQHNYLPIPIIHADYEINARELAASRSLGNPLDTTSAEQATRRIREKLESMLFTNTDFGFGEKDSRLRNKIYSYLNFPDRCLVSLGTAWDDSAKTGAQIVADVMSMKEAAIEKNHRGPFYLYIPTKYDLILDEDYSSAKGENTIRDRIMKISGIEAIKVNDTLPANNVVLVQMTSDVVRLVRGMGITNVQWETEGKMLSKYKVMTIQVPQIRSDQKKQCGIVHMS